MESVAVILAGGKGSRFGSVRPKQFAQIEGKTILALSIEAFEQNENISRIAIVCSKEYEQDVVDIVKHEGYKKVDKILYGGKERYHSTLSAIRAYSGEDLNLLFHDAVRPLVSQRIIDDCLTALQRYEVVNVACSVVDTIVETDGRGQILRTLDRSKLRAVQTPQCFRLEVIERAYELALQDADFQTTDDCSVVQRYIPEQQIYVVEGEPTNIKITYPYDMLVAQKILELRK